MRTRIPLPRFILTASIAALAWPAWGADFIKLQNTTALNTAGAWKSGANNPSLTAPGSGDVLVWDATFTTPVNPRTAGLLSPLGGDLAVLGIRVANVGGTVNAANSGIGFQNANSANTLTLGASGIDMSAATQMLYIESKVLLSANQTWNIANANTNGSPAGNANGEDLSFRAQTAASATTANTSFNLGGFAVATTGSGAINFTSGYNVTNGTFNLGNTLTIFAGGDTRAILLGSDLNLNVGSGATLQFQSNSGITTSNAAIGLNGGTLKLVSGSTTNAVTVGGTITVNNASTLQIGNTVGNTGSAGTIAIGANLAGSADLSFVQNSTAVPIVTFSGNNSSYAGTFSLSGTAGRITQLSTATAGSAAATWNIGTGETLSLNAVNVNLGTLNGAGGVSTYTAGASNISVGAGSFSGTLSNGTGTLGLTKVGAGTLTLSGPNTYTGPTLVQAGTLIGSTAATGAGDVTVADGAAFRVAVALAGTTRNVNTLATGTTAGATLGLDIGTTGNPNIAVITANTFTVNAPTVIDLTGSSLTPNVGSPFVAISYGAISGLGAGGLSLRLPFRTTGNLVNGPGAVAVEISGVAVPVWRGTVNGNWDIDTSGTGAAGTANWLASIGPNTYVEAPGKQDAVRFDDTVGSGPKNVNLAATITPRATPTGVTVDNSAVDYTFSGAGKISGGTGLVKSGTGTLTLSNTGGNDFSGGVNITAGTLRLGDGATVGGGSLGSGAVAIGGTLDLNRPADFSLANALSGTGTLQKSSANVASLSSAFTFGGNVQINAGTLKFDGGGTTAATITDNATLAINSALTLGGTIAGTGGLSIQSGTTALTGATANTFTGLTNVAGGTLQLNKNAGTNALGGDVTLNGGNLTWVQADQVADGASITVNSGTMALGNRPETIKNLTINSALVQNFSGATITGTLTVTTGAKHDAVNSNGSTFANTVAVSNASLFIGANAGGDSTFNIGSGGLSLTDASLTHGSVGDPTKFATVTLAGDVTSAGTSAFFVNTGNPMGRIDLGAATRTFTVTGGTLSVDPAIVSATSTAGLTKAGPGTMVLRNGVNTNGASTYTGPTTINAGTLLVNGSLSGTATTVAGGVFGGNGLLTGTLQVNSGAHLIGGTAAAASDDFAIAGDVSLLTGSDLQLTLGAGLTHSSLTRFSGNWSFATAQSFTFTNLGATPGLYDNVIAGLAVDPVTTGWVIANPGWVGTFTYDGAGGVDLNLTAIPEPASASWLLLGLAAVLARRPRRAA